jgi:hypothetical protein
LRFAGGPARFDVGRISDLKRTANARICVLQTVVLYGTETMPVTSVSILYRMWRVFP